MAQSTPPLKEQRAAICARTATTWTRMGRALAVIHWSSPDTRLRMPWIALRGRLLLASESKNTFLGLERSGEITNAGAARGIFYVIL